MFKNIAYAFLFRRTQEHGICGLTPVVDELDQWPDVAQDRKSMEG